MDARQRSLNNASFISKWLGFLFVAAGVTLLNKEHPYVSGFLSFGFFISGAFFLSTRRVQPERNGLKYRTWFRWHTVPYSEIQKCGEAWVYGYVRLRQFTFPWGSIYFVRPTASNSLFGLDKELISTIRSSAHVLKP
jgi:hypothetical protein